MRPDATAPEAHGYSLSKGDNKVWPHFGRNPSGWGCFGGFRYLSSLADAGYVSLLAASYFPAQNSGGPGSGSQRGLRGNWNGRMNNWR
jgi:hypothetical protein